MQINKVSPENPEGILVDLTPEEEAQYQADITDRATTVAAEEAAATQKATDQAAGNQKLLDLGLTQAEATALTGYTPPEE